MAAGDDRAIGQVGDKVAEGPEGQPAGTQQFVVRRVPVAWVEAVNEARVGLEVLRAEAQLVGQPYQ